MQTFWSHVVNVIDILVGCSKEHYDIFQVDLFVMVLINLFKDLLQQKYSIHTPLEKSISIVWSHIVTASLRPPCIPSSCLRPPCREREEWCPRGDPSSSSGHHSSRQRSAAHLLQPLTGNRPQLCQPRPVARVI